VAARRNRGDALVSKVKLYVEGGGRSKEHQARCREGFSKLIGKAGFTGRMPAIVAGGSRNDAYRAFTIAQRGQGDVYPLLLVDSEDPVTAADESPDSPMAWDHLARRDGWERPSIATNDQAQLMTTCMESWLIADSQTLQQHFGANFRANALPDNANLESVTRQAIQQSLLEATKDCGRQKMYRKGDASFQILAKLNPAHLERRLLHFRRFLQTLERCL
jgi:hypothetical protein